MDSERLELATTIIHAISIFGFITNFIAIITIAKSMKMHNSFGILCAFLAANNCVVLVLNSVWYLMPESGIFKTGSTVSRVVGMTGLTFWLVGIRFHILISFNRFVLIVFPFSSKKYVTARKTSISATVALLIAIVQCSPQILVDDIVFCYDREHVQWEFARNEISLVYSFYFYYLSVTIELLVVLLLDVLTIANLRTANLKNTIVHSNETNASRRKTEIRLFYQAFLQCLPLWSTLVLFGFLNPHLTNEFAKFLSTTVIWHLAHGLDGLIIDLFHTRLELFVKKHEHAISAAPSSFVTTVA